MYTYVLRDKNIALQRAVGCGLISHMMKTRNEMVKSRYSHIPFFFFSLMREENLFSPAGLVHVGRAG